MQFPVSLLYGATVLIWGSSWLAITFQLGTVAPSWSVAWRFALAAALLFAFRLLRGPRTLPGGRHQLGMALQAHSCSRSTTTCSIWPSASSPAA